MAQKMEQVPLGGQGLMVSRQGLGCMGMSAFYVSSAAEHEPQALATIDEALKQGINFLDTAYVYRSPKGERNECLVGKAVSGRRSQFVIATKFGIEFVDGEQARDSSPANVRRSCEDSLKALGVDCIDLYYQHRMDPNTPIEDTMRELKALVQEGKIKYVGLSEVSAAVLRRAHAIHPVTAIQMEWSLWTRDAERDVVPTARELGIGIVCYSPLGGGFLTGAIKTINDLPEGDWRRAQPRLSKENFEANLRAVKRLEALASQWQVTAAQVALAWLHARGKDVVPIPGTKSPKRLLENAQALALANRLTPDQLAQIEAAVPYDQIKGGRFIDDENTYRQKM